MKNVYIIGVGETTFGKHLGVQHRVLAEQAINSALADAGVKKEELQSVHASNCTWGYFSGQTGIRGQIIARHCGIYGPQVTNHEAACASAISALNGAYKDILTGMFDCSLAFGVEKLISEDKSKSLNVFGGFVDIDNQAEHSRITAEQLKAITVQGPPSDTERSVFMDIYSLAARRHMQERGSTQRQLAAIAAKNHNNGALNPNAQYRFRMTIEEVLADKLVAWPLTRAMCSPIGDGAAAAIVCSEEFLRKLPQETQNRAVKILACVMRSNYPYGAKLPSGLNAFADVIQRAYEQAGKGPGDIDVAEVHDASAVGELEQSEHLGFFKYGEGGPAAEAGETEITGSKPINPSGGLIARGHPIGATGLAQIFELVTQVRGEAGERQVKGAKIGLSQNAGGDLLRTGAALSCTILEKA